jgi:hypothetical protein
MNGSSKRVYKIKVYNKECDRVDYHEDLSKWDVDWIKSCQNLKVEILEVKTLDSQANEAE